MSDRLRAALDAMEDVKTRANGAPVVYLHRPPDPRDPMRGHPPFAALVDLDWLDDLIARAGIEDFIDHDHCEGDEDEWREGAGEPTALDETDEPGMMPDATDPDAIGSPTDHEEGLR